MVYLIELAEFNGSGVSYSVEYKTNLNQVSWLTLSNVVGTGSSFSITDVYGSEPHRFYRLVITP
jgi:hypothetical protein